ncbi:flippase activity-associated protein Agl23 [Occallatibacter riparius]|uniref:TIGR03663 family protein n=1 Tax=Occallatibacter riparius TaxID=1002689 RepID=A0A9J7BHB7_9BACT|nr:flippase activity-associated protein Agl23 [Occallatibacter riparius]UWZ81913.1 TIGR03663 family protein [Occallatibacter riparius]
MEKASPRRLWSRWLAFLFIALIGLAVRLPQLGTRPMHTDEAVNAYIVGQLLAGEKYTYDPQDRHGPALATLALPLVRLQGARSFADLTESKLRLIPVVAGTITILLFGAAVDLFGLIPCMLAALLLAVAPLPVYYDRYFIHESLFCAATIGLILSGWRAAKTRSVGYAALAGACAALMFACKETSVLHWFALAAAGFASWLLNPRHDRPAGRWRAAPPLSALGAFLALALLLFTGFGTNWKGLTTLAKVAPDALSRAAGQGHEKAFWYYGRLLTGGWSGGLLCALACIGFVLAIRKRDASAYRLLACYGLFIAIIYSSIPYKTPWLALNLWLPLALLAAKATESVWHWIATTLGPRAAYPLPGALAVIAAVLIAHDTRQRVFLHAADEANPYAYAHTTEDILGLEAEIHDLAHKSGIARPRIAVIASDPWPLPWYLRQFDQVGFYQPGQQVPDADFYITSNEASQQYTDQLRDLRPDFFGVRPNVLILLWIPAPK